MRLWAAFHTGDLRGPLYNAQGALASDPPEQMCRQFPGPWPAQGQNYLSPSLCHGFTEGKAHLETRRARVSPVDYRGVGFGEEQV